MGNILLVKIVPIGYADILPRSSSGKLYVYINGSRRKVLGNISMDQTVVQGKARDKIHDEVLFFGNPEKGDKMWQTCQTPSHMRCLLEQITV